MKFHPYPRVVSAEFRELTLERFPRLRGDTKEAKAFRGLAAHSLFAPYVWTPNDEAQLLLTHTAVAYYAGVSPESGSFRSGELLDRFSRAVFDLRVRSHVYSRGEARVIFPKIPDEILQARDEGLPRELRGPEPVRVDFITGRMITPRRLSLEMKAASQAMLEGVVYPPHERAEMLEWLNTQPQNMLDHVVKQNWGEAVGLAEAMAPSSSREATWRVLSHLAQDRTVIYGTSPNTDRFVHLGTSIVQLPKHIRDALLKGTIQMDMKSCQLAIVAKLWEVPALFDFLAAGRSIWKELAGWMKVDVDTFKPILKDTIYATCYGMGEKKLLALLTHGADGKPGVGNDAARRFFKHPLIAALLQKRKEVADWAAATGGLVDAWGGVIVITPETPVHAAMAQQAQSWEVRIMMGILPVAKRNPDLRIPLWLHEGIYVKPTNASKADRQMRQLEEALNRQAVAFDVPTWVEIER